MGFEEIVDTPERRRLIENVRVALRTPAYAHNEHQVFDNIAVDPLIPDHGCTKPASRQALLEHVARSDGDAMTTYEAVQDFCHRHVREGPVDETARNAHLGCVRSLASVADRVSANSGLSPSQAKQHLRDLMAVADSMERLNEQREALKETVLSKYQIWAFYNPSAPHAPFGAVGVAREGLVNILGLGRWKGSGEELVRWAHRLPGNMTAHTPTAWDADVSPDSSPHWRPGGKTCPLDSLDPTQGCREVVHRPIKGEVLTEPMSPLVD